MLLILLIGIRIIFFTTPLPLLSNELEWMLVGQKLNEGLSLYREVLTQIGPFSSYFFQILDTFIGVNQQGYEAVAAAVVLLQCLMFNFFINKRGLFNEKTYLPGLLYLIITTVSFDLMKLSPALLANTFIMMAVNSLLSQIEKREGVGDDVFEAGIFIGIATLFHQPAFVFIFWAVLILFLYTGATIRQAFMVIIAFLLPILFTYLFFYYNQSNEEFAQIWLFNFNTFIDLSWLNVRDIIISFTIPIALSLLGILKVLTGLRYTNFQNRGHQAIMILGIFAFISFILSGRYLALNLIYFIGPLAFFCAGFFIHNKKVVLPEIILIIFFSTVLFISFIGAKDIVGLSINQLADFRLNQNYSKLQYQNKRIFITGRSIHDYQNNYVATGYLSWNLARKDFENPNNYLSISNIHNNFKKDMPEVIVDYEEVMPAVFKNIPELAKKYKQASPNIYELK